MASLFSPDEYTSPQDSGREPRAPRGGRQHWYREHLRAEEAIPSDGTWVVISGVEGPLDFVHRLAKNQPENLQVVGSAVTRCEEVGRVLYTPDKGAEVLPCPDCVT